MTRSTSVRPRVTIKLAQTLDGRIATTSGHSRWISGPQSRALAHRLRAEHDGVLVGIGTVLADNPRLTVRLSQGHSPLRLVADSRLRTPLDAAILGDDPERVILATTGLAAADRVREFEGRGVRVLPLPADSDGVELTAMLQALADAGIRSLLVEGGVGIVTSFLRRRLADELVAFVAPKILGTGLEAIGDLGSSSIDDAIRLAEISVERSGEDIVVRGELDWSQVKATEAGSSE